MQQYHIWTCSLFWSLGQNLELEVKCAEVYLQIEIGR